MRLCSPFLFAVVAILGLYGCNRVELDRDDMRELARAGRELANELSATDASDPAPGEPRPSESAASAPAPERPAAAEPATYYRYTDDAGSLRFVSSLDQVPPHLRGGARPAGGSFTRTSSPTARPATRPFARQGADPSLRRGAEVVVYTAPWCGWCRKTLTWLDRRGVAYDNRDIEQDDRYRRELLAKSGRTSIPFVEIDGESVRGYAPERMARLLDD